jgi:hypothetical protein
MKKKWRVRLEGGTCPNFFLSPVLFFSQKNTLITSRLLSIAKKYCFQHESNLWP